MRVTSLTATTSVPCHTSTTASSSWLRGLQLTVFASAAAKRCSTSPFLQVGRPPMASEVLSSGGRQPPHTAHDPAVPPTTGVSTTTGSDVATRGTKLATSDKLAAAGRDDDGASMSSSEVATSAANATPLKEAARPDAESRRRNANGAPEGKPRKRRTIRCVRKKMRVHSCRQHAHLMGLVWVGCDWEQQMDSGRGPTNDRSRREVWHSQVVCHWCPADWPQWQAVP